MRDQFTFPRDLFEEQLARYTDHQRRTIEAYFAIIALTRKTKKIAAGVIEKEFAYWEQFSPDTVIAALRLHINKYAGKPEKYTRGIMRNLTKEEQHGVTRQYFEEPQRGSFGESDRDRYVREDEPLPI